MARQKISSGTSWESQVGYSRAVRVGNHVMVAGTTASDENTQPVSPGDAYNQTIYILRKIERALQLAGAALNDVVRTRMFITDLGSWPGVQKAHGEIFRDIRPVATVVVVSALIAPEYLVEIEVDAIVDV